MSEIKLHLGCGKRYLKGYCHIDLADFPHIDYRHNVTSLPMFSENMADLIYASHVFEYFDRFQARDILKEWRRVLKPGGVLRLAVPDIEALIRVYEETGKIESILGPMYGRWQTSEEFTIYHRTIYDRHSLASLLEQNGFTDIRPWNWQEVFTGENKGFDDFSQSYFPHMDKKSGLLVSLNIEAIKG